MAETQKSYERSKVGGSFSAELIEQKKKYSRAAHCSGRPFSYCTCGNVTNHSSQSYQSTNAVSSKKIRMWLSNYSSAELMFSSTPSAGICVSCRIRSCGRARHATWPTWCGARWRSRWTARCASTRRAWTSPSNTSCPPRSPWGWQDSAKSQWVTLQTHRRSSRAARGFLTERLHEGCHSRT